MGLYEIGATDEFDPSYINVSLQDPILVFPHHVHWLGNIENNRPAKISLSPLDRQTPFYSYLLLFYNNHALKETESVISELKTALQQVLVLYFPLSGRLRKDDNTGYVGIECTNEGVLLVEASIKDDHELNFLHNFKLFNSNFEDKLLYKLEPTSDNPLLTVQITRFSSGGFALGIGRRHEIFDGFGIYCFMQAWADIARGKPLSSIPRPSYSRQILQPKAGSSYRSTSDWQSNLKAQYQGIPIYTFSNEKEAREWAVTDTASFTSSPLYITKIFPITKPMISALKKKAMEGGFLRGCTTFEVVISHVWVARVKAFDLQAHERTLLSFAVNARSRTDPPLPEHYTGNAFVVASSNSGVEDLVRSPFHAIVERVQKAKASVGEKYIESMVAFLDEAGVKALSSYRETSIVTDWTKFAFHKIDFGWGGASFVSPAALPLRDVMYAVRTGLEEEEEGGISLRLGLPAHAMPKFEEYLYQI